MFSTITLCGGLCSVSDPFKPLQPRECVAFSLGASAMSLVVSACCVFKLDLVLGDMLELKVRFFLYRLS